MKKGCPAEQTILITELGIRQSKNSLPHTSLEFVAKMLPFFSNSDRSGDGGGVAFWPRSFFWVGSSRSDPWLMSSLPGAEDSGIVINLVDPEA